jgi:hypothetical protein
MAICTQNAAVYAENIMITLSFKNLAMYSDENWSK